MASPKDEAVETELHVDLFVEDVIEGGVEKHEHLFFADHMHTPLWEEGE